MLTTRKWKSHKHKTPPLANKQPTTTAHLKHLQSGLKPSLLGVLFTNKLPLKKKCFSDPDKMFVVQMKWTSLKYIFQASAQPLNSFLWLLISELLDKREGEGRGHWGSASCSWKQLTEALEKGAPDTQQSTSSPLPLSRLAVKWAVCSVCPNLMP